MNEVRIRRISAMLNLGIAHRSQNKNEVFHAVEARDILCSILKLMKQNKSHYSDGLRSFVTGGACSYISEACHKLQEDEKVQEYFEEYADPLDLAVAFPGSNSIDSFRSSLTDDIIKYGKESIFFKKLIRTYKPGSEKYIYLQRLLYWSLIEHERVIEATLHMNETYESAVSNLGQDHELTKLIKGEMVGLTASFLGNKQMQNLGYKKREKRSDDQIFAELMLQGSAGHPVQILGVRDKNYVVAKRDAEEGAATKVIVASPSQIKFENGTQIICMGLTGATQLNGEQGFITSFDRNSNRYGVTFHDTSLKPHKANIKRENIKLQRHLEEL